MATGSSVGTAATVGLTLAVTGVVAVTAGAAVTSVVVTVVVVPTVAVVAVVSVMTVVAPVAADGVSVAAACEEVLPVVAVVTLLLGERVKMTKAIAATMSTAIKMMMFRF